MSRDWLAFFDDMLEACQRILNYAEGMDWQGFQNDEKTHDALLLNVQVLGEAAKHIPDSVRALAADIPWKPLIATRNVVSHAYFALDDEMVWDIVRNKTPVLHQQLLALRNQHPELFS